MGCTEPTGYGDDCVMVAESVDGMDVVVAGVTTDARLTEGGDVERLEAVELDCVGGAIGPGPTVPVLIETNWVLGSEVEVEVDVGEVGEVTLVAFGGVIVDMVPVEVTKGDSEVDCSLKNAVATAEEGASGIAVDEKVE